MQFRVAEAVGADQGQAAHRDGAEQDGVGAAHERAVVRLPGLAGVHQPELAAPGRGDPALGRTGGQQRDQAEDEQQQRDPERGAVAAGLVGDQQRGGDGEGQGDRQGEPDAPVRGPGPAQPLRVAQQAAGGQGVADGLDGGRAHHRDAQ